MRKTLLLYGVIRGWLLQVFLRLLFFLQAILMVNLNELHSAIVLFSILVYAIAAPILVANIVNCHT